MTKLWKHTRKG
uniref:Stress inducible family protein n=1 Tax=Rhizophora mucronata TaxID=61149 RepID=A0A2P2JUY2_RHIMU